MNCFKNGLLKHFIITFFLFTFYTYSKKTYRFYIYFQKSKQTHTFLNMQSIVQYITEGLPLVHCDKLITETGSCHARYRFTVPVIDATITLEFTPFYVQIQMNEKVFRWGDKIRLLELKIIKHYANAFIRLIQTNMLVARFNQESKVARIEFSLGPSNFLLYNLPMISMDLIPNGREEGCVLMRHLISEKHWIPALREGYPPNPNPLFADEIYYRSTTGIKPLPRMDFCDVCHLLVEKMVR